MGFFRAGLLLAALSSNPIEDADRARLAEATRWIQGAPARATELRYAMTARVRLLLFWVGRDDVGGGYIRRGQDGAAESIEVLFGSDPNRAPRRINRWGAATEVRRHDPSESSVLFGFMKASKGNSVAEMEKELHAENARGGHLFEAIVSRVDPRRAVSRVVPFRSDVDFNLNELESARSMVLERLDVAPPSVRRWDDPTPSTCSEAQGFLFAVSGLLENALAGRRATLATCYVYNARPYVATLESVEAVPRASVSFKHEGRPKQNVYTKLLRTRFDVLNLDKKSHTRFEILLGTEGERRGVPLQITHQPNWWFKVVLNVVE